MTGRVVGQGEHSIKKTNNTKKIISGHLNVLVLAIGRNL